MLKVGWIFTGTRTRNSHYHVRPWETLKSHPVLKSRWKGILKDSPFWSLQLRLLSVERHLHPTDTSKLDAKENLKKSTHGPSRQWQIGRSFSCLASFVVWTHTVPCPYLLFIITPEKTKRKNYLGIHNKKRTKLPPGNKFRPWYHDHRHPKKD